MSTYSNTVVLFSPEIPQNTGNIARLCAVTNTALHLVGSLGFSLDEKYIRRAGLDYWQYVKLTHYPDTQKYVQNILFNEAYLFSSKADVPYIHANFSEYKNNYLCFGNETSGVPQDIMQKFSAHNRLVRIPMAKNRRCLNLAVSAGIGLYEALRQQNFEELM